MRTLQWIPVCIFTIVVMVATVSAASAKDKEYTIKWVNNMDYFSSTNSNTGGFCTNLKAQLLNKKGEVEASSEYSGTLNVHDVTMMRARGSSCKSMKLSGTCVYKGFDKVMHSESRTITAAECASGKAVFVIGNYSLFFAPGEQ